MLPPQGTCEITSDHLIVAERLVARQGKDPVPKREIMSWSEYGIAVSAPWRWKQKTKNNKGK